MIKPKLGYIDSSVVVMSLVIGIGIFRTPALVAGSSENEFIFFLLWLIGGLIALAGGLVFAELGARKPLAGGFYKLVSEAFHPAFAFMLNWAGIIILSGITYAAMALLSAEYLTKIIPFEINSKYLACTTVIILFFINFSGIKTGSLVLNLIILLKIAMIIFFILSAFIFSGTDEIPSGKAGISGDNLLNGLIAVFFTYSGYQLTMNLSADVKKPIKNLPRAILTGIGISVILYLLINMGYYKLLGLEGIASSPLIAADAVKMLFGETGSKIFSFLIFISAFAFLNVSMMHSQRAFFAMAEDKVIPAFFMKAEENRQSQYFALVFISLLTVLFILIYETFENALNLIMFLETLTIAITSSTVFIFRSRTDNDEYKGFRMPFYPVLPSVFILIILAVSINAFINDITSGLISTVFFLAGFPVYFILKRIFIKRGLDD